MNGSERRSGTRGRLGAAVVFSSAVVAALVVFTGGGFAKEAISASQYQYGTKVTICHRTHSKKHPFVTISVSAKAWRAHERHGDTLGACGASAPGDNAIKKDDDDHGASVTRGSGDPGDHDRGDRGDRADHGKSDDDHGKSDDDHGKSDDDHGNGHRGDGSGDDSGAKSERQGHGEGHGHGRK